MDASCLMSIGSNLLVILSALNILVPMIERDIESSEIAVVRSSTIEIPPFIRMVLSVRFMSWFFFL